MQIVALILAGGRNQRLRDRFGELKPLVPVRGVPLIERHLLAVLGHGVRRVVIAVPAHAPELRSYIDDRARALGRAMGAQVSMLIEDCPLGTIGAALRLPADASESADPAGCASPGDPADMAAGVPASVHDESRSDTVLVINSDILTTLRLDRLVEFHQEHNAAMTVAAHHQGWRSALGEIEVAGEHVISYREKPLHHTLVASGVHVLGRPALDGLARILADRRAHAAQAEAGPAASQSAPDRIDAPELVRALLVRGIPVRAYHHQAAWIDVCDAAAVMGAAEQIAAHSDELECWLRVRPPDAILAGILVHGGRGMLIERRPESAPLYPGQWALPCTAIGPGELPAHAAERVAHSELGLHLGAASDDSAPALEPVVVFDDIDVITGQAVRHHVFSADIGQSAVVATRPRPSTWLSPRSGVAPLSPVLARALAAWRELKAARAATLYRTLRNARKPPGPGTPTER